MGQYDIVQFLKRKDNKGKWISARKVCRRFGTTLNSANRCLRGLVKAGMIERKDKRKTTFKMYHYRLK
jgi:DNA-binding IclR family transcriptional regulator